MTTIRDVNIRLMLSRLRPTSEYLWIGEGETGNTIDAIKEWRDRTTSKPTENELVTEWGKYLPEQTSTQQAEQQREQKLAQARQDYGTSELDVIAYGSQSVLIQKLAQKIVLLEREITDLRRGG